MLIRDTLLPIASTISSNAFSVSSASFEPFFTLLMESSIISSISLAADELFAAKLLTSSATTANPLPASPALAASTAAFRERILVWKEISLITLIIFEIFSDA